MTDKKFTDEEIIKSLECCAKSKTMRDCLKSKCPFSKEWELCSSKEPQMLYLDLINRQKAEIKRYKRYYYRHEYDEREKEIKTEAYQEFAKFLIDKSSKGLLRTSDLPDYVKEMAGN